MTNAQKTPLTRTLNAFATRKAMEQIEQEGQALPGVVVSANGPIVTVNFQVKNATIPQCTMPVFGSEYIRIPIQPGDKGVAFPASVFIGGVSGLGAGVADPNVPQANLSTLVWFPIGNKNWSAVDGNSVVMYGPNGVTVRDSLNKASIVLTPTAITMTVGGKTIVINSSGVTIDGLLWDTHQHTGVTTGSGLSGGPVA